MKFEFELDGIDTENFHDVFRSMVRKIVILSFHATEEKLPSGLRAYMHGCIHELQITADLYAKIFGKRDPVTDIYISQFIKEWGEPQYSEE